MHGRNINLFIQANKTYIDSIYLYDHFIKQTAEVGCSYLQKVSRVLHPHPASPVSAHPPNE